MKKQTTANVMASCDISIRYTCATHSCTRIQPGQSCRSNRLRAAHSGY